MAQSSLKEHSISFKLQPLLIFCIFFRYVKPLEEKTYHNFHFTVSTQHVLLKLVKHAQATGERKKLIRFGEQNRGNYLLVDL